MNYQRKEPSPQKLLASNAVLPTEVAVSLCLWEYCTNHEGHTSHRKIAKLLRSRR